MVVVAVFAAVVVAVAVVKTAPNYKKAFHILKGFFFIEIILFMMLNRISNNS